MGDEITNLTNESSLNQAPEHLAAMMTVHHLMEGLLDKNVAGESIIFVAVVLFVLGILAIPLHRKEEAISCQDLATARKKTEVNPNFSTLANSYVTYSGSQ